MGFWSWQTDLSSSDVILAPGNLGLNVVTKCEVENKELVLELEFIQQRLRLRNWAVTHHHRCASDKPAHEPLLARFTRCRQAMMVEKHLSAFVAEADLPPTTPPLPPPRQSPEWLAVTKLLSFLLASRTTTACKRMSFKKTVHWKKVKHEAIETWDKWVVFLLKAAFLVSRGKASRNKNLRFLS